jgi:hypothetical protein
MNLLLNAKRSCSLLSDGRLVLVFRVEVIEFGGT